MVIKVINEHAHTQNEIKYNAYKTILKIAIQSYQQVKVLKCYEHAYTHVLRLAI